jgi:hypothetical protein
MSLGGVLFMLGIAGYLLWYFNRNMDQTSRDR